MKNQKLALSRCIKQAKIILAGATLFSVVAMTSNSGFLAEQKRYPRVRAAISDKEEMVKEMLSAHGIAFDNFELIFRALKQEKLLEVYAKNKGETTFKKIVTYKVCRASGSPGPKRRQGDRQVPEGFYHIDRFNPSSNFHLSLGINYPNLSDRRKSTAADPGGDIFIHGACASAGCLAMTDDKIKAIYVLAMLAKHNGQEKIPVYIYPFEMTEHNMRLYRLRYWYKPELISFWENLKEGYDRFEATNEAMDVRVDRSGDYQFSACL